MIKVIKTEQEYNEALEMAEELIDKDPKPGTQDADKLELLTLLIENYEESHHKIDPPDPIEALKFRMEQQGLTQKDLIPYIGSRSKVSEILNRKRPLTLNMMRALNRNLEIPAEVLLQKNSIILEEDTDIDWQKFPITEMVKRKLFPDFTGTVVQAKENAEELIRKFFRNAGVRNIQPALYRKNVRAGSCMDEYALFVWHAIVENKAEKNLLPNKYKHGTINREFMKKLAGLSYFKEGPQLAKEFLEKNGIHLIIEPHFRKTYLDGAAIRNKDKNPIVALTLRYDRIDNFWFSLCHELAHIVLHLDKDQAENPFFDNLEVEGNDLEKEADHQTKDWLIPRKEWERSDVLNHPLPVYIKEFAEQLKIHPAIIAGRIRHERKNYRILSQMVGKDEVRRLFGLN
ncbi:MAG: hypothetical protein KKH98_09025 [Spirochaetes bacterium]|nr:hypothetical protein [Spirochaetota bacterium]